MRSMTSTLSRLHSPSTVQAALDEFAMGPRSSSAATNWTSPRRWAKPSFSIGSSGSVGRRPWTFYGVTCQDSCPWSPLISARTPTVLGLGEHAVARLLGMARTPAESKARVGAAVDRLVTIGMASELEESVRATR